MDIVGLLISKKWDEIEGKLNDTNIHFVKNGSNLLWIAINGKFGRANMLNTEFANYDTVNLLLNKGINPNTKSVLMTSLYSSLFHERYDITHLLLTFGANPNESSVIKVKNKRMVCDVPLNLAIRKFNVEIVELLIINGAFYNNMTINKVKRGMKLMKKEKRHSSYHTDYAKLEKIVKILKENYKDENENIVAEYIKASTKTGAYDNFFSCFENF